MEEEIILKAECILDRIYYPKYSKKVNAGEYAIFRAEITKRLENCEESISSLKLKGNVCTLEYGTTYKIFCKLSETHEVYGDTYEIVYISKCIDISSKDKQKEFLKNIINENLVEKLFDKYDDVIKLLEERDIESLMEIKGIRNQVALKLVDEYEEAKDYSSVYMELGQLGMTHTFIKKLVDFYHSPDTVIDVVRNNPYDLIKMDGVGFKKADEIACKAGIGQYDICRIKGFLLYYLNEQGEAGKSYLDYQELMKALYDTLGFIPEEVINATAKKMIEDGDIVVLENGLKIALRRFYDLEKNIMDELIRLQKGSIKVIEKDASDSPGKEINCGYTPKTFTISKWEDIIQKVEEKQGFPFTQEQKDAIKLSLSNNVMALTGGAGMGKTSTANGICSMYNNYNITACALSGKASVRITEATGLPASTIHRALGYMNGKFKFNKDNRLQADIVLVDEATMINGTLFLSLLEAVPTGAKMVIMGDVQQLTPIGNCQVFADVLDSGVLPVVRLTKPHRQALESGIIPASIKIANQEQIFTNNFEGKEILGELQDMELDITSSKETLADSYKRLIAPSIEREIRNELTEKAEDGAIKVFGKNLTQLLMQPPITGQVVLGWDPAFRTGCKLAVVDPTGKVIGTTVIYPTAPTTPQKIKASKDMLKKIIAKYHITLISVGNGTASRESEMFIVELLMEIPQKVQYVIVNEAGASVYSASKLASEEFPKFDVGQRSATSIARRLQDPLAELVKIDPKSIGVGQYQHDMNQKKLSGALSGVVEDCVNRVGVDLNTASAPLLSYISGISGAIAKNIVAYREENGRFVSRKQLLKVAKLGPKAFEQCAGFMRIQGGDNPLDATGVHPESYEAAEKLLEKQGFRPEDIIGGKLVGLSLTIKDYKKLAEELGIGEITLRDIVKELEKPARDPREEMPKPILRTDVLEMKDLKEGMILKGTVRNVIDFGVFVDIGVHQDGLVHISQITEKFIKHPLEVVSVGDIVDVKVMSVDLKKKRIQLTMRGIS